MIASIPLRPITKTARRLNTRKVKAVALAAPILPHMHASRELRDEEPPGVADFPKGDGNIFGGSTKNRVITRKNIESLVETAEERGDSEYAKCAKKCFEGFEESKCVD